MNPFPVLKSERLILRQFSFDDLEFVYRGLSHPDVIKYYGISFHSLEATKEQIEWYAMLEKEQKGIWWAITSYDGTFYGTGGFHDWNHEHRSAEYGLWLMPECWGKGIMQEATPLIEAYAFSKEGMNLHRIFSYVESENVNCLKAVRKLNYTHEGTLRESEWKNGAFIDLEIFAKLSNLG